MQEEEENDDYDEEEDEGKKHIKIHPIGNCGCNKMARSDYKFLRISAHEFCLCALQRRKRVSEWN